MQWWIHGHVCICLDFFYNIYVCIHHTMHVCNDRQVQIFNMHHLPNKKKKEFDKPTFPDLVQFFPSFLGRCCQQIWIRRWCNIWELAWFKISQKIITNRRVSETDLFFEWLNRRSFQTFVSNYDVDIRCFNEDSLA